MLRKRRSHFSSRKKKMHLQWWATQQAEGFTNKGGFIPTNMGTWVAMTSATTSTQVLIGTTTNVGVINGPGEVPNTPMSITAMNIRGDIVWRSDRAASPDAVLTTFTHGIIVETRNPDGSLPFRDPQDPAQAEMPWMWLYTDVLSSAVQTALGEYGGPNMLKRVAVDIRTRRRLNDNQDICLHTVVANFTATASIVAAFRPGLRVLYGSIPA